MADLSDVELVQELNRYGENISTPIKASRRPILLKKLNHLRVRHKKEELSSSPTKGSPRPSPAASRPASSSRFRPNTRAYDGPSNLEALSSDDSDLEVSGQRDTQMLSIFSNNSRPSPSLRRRATDLDSLSPPPPVTRRTRSQVLDASRGTSRGDNKVDGDMSFDAPGPSKLYPDLSRLSSSLHNQNTDNFESSDSDGDLGSYSVGDNSVQSSLPPFVSSRTRFDGPSSSKVSPSHDFSLSTPLRRSFYGRRYPLNGPRSPLHRVQPYRSVLSDHFPFVLLTVVALFFIGLFAVYVIQHKDFIVSWFSNKDGNVSGSENNFLYCKDETPLHHDQNCFTQEEVNKAMEYINDVYSQLSSKKGAVICNQAKQGEDILKASVLRARIGSNFTERTAERMYRCCILHILANPHWNLMAFKGDGTEATSYDEVIKLESSQADMSFWCRLHRSFTWVTSAIVYAFLAMVCAVLLYFFIKYYMNRRGKEQREVYAMVDRIIDILQKHHQEHKRDNSDESPYLAVQHVRDQLLPPAERRQYQHVWDKAVEFITANESRIRLEAKMIQGEQFDVWYWLQPGLHNGKVWQGQAFGENDASNQIIYSPSPCLKIRNMFDSSVENEEENWEDGVIDAALEKCRGICTVVHIFVDVESKEGCVYMKCSSCEEAGKARNALNGWWFDGRLVRVKHLKTDHYHKRWPESQSAITPLKPSTNQMRSLSQPFYRSSIEMT